MNVCCVGCFPPAVDLNNGFCEWPQGHPVWGVAEVSFWHCQVIYLNRGWLHTFLCMVLSVRFKWQLQASLLCLLPLADSAQPVQCQMILTSLLSCLPPSWGVHSACDALEFQKEAKLGTHKSFNYYKFTSAKCMWNSNLWKWRVTFRLGAIKPVWVLEMRYLHTLKIYYCGWHSQYCSERSSCLESYHTSTYLFSKDRQRHFLTGLLGLILLMVGFGSSEHSSVQIRVVMCMYFFKKNQNNKETSLGIIVHPADSSHPS